MTFLKYIVGMKRSRLAPWLLSGILLLGGLGVTAGFWRHAQQQDAANLHAAFELSADHISSNIRSRFSSCATIMRGVKGFVEGSEHISFDEFRTYVNALKLDQSAGVQGIGLATVIPDAEKNRHTEWMHKQGLPDYQIKPEGQREQYAPIVRMEPMSGTNLKALGLDILTVPEARAAMQQATDTGDVAITSRLTLTQDAEKPGVSGFVMYLPIYRNEAKFDTPIARRTAIVGWVDVPFRMSDLMDGLRGEIDSDIDFEIHDGTALAKQTLMYRSNEVHSEAKLARGMLQTSRQIKVGGSQWTLLMNTTPAFVARVSPRGQPTMVAAAGVALTLALSWLAWLLARGRESAQTRYRQLFDQTGDGILILAADYHFIDANAAALQMLGYTHEELLKLRLSDIMEERRSPRLEISIGELITDADNLEERVHVRKDGTMFPAEMSTRKLDHEDYFIILRDITERKQAENQLRLHAHVFESSQEGILITDAHNDIISVNRAFTEISGYLPEEVIGKNPRMLASGKRDKSFDEAMWRDIMNQGRWQGEVISRRKNGDSFPQWLSVSLVRDQDGQIVQHIGILGDLSERKAAEERIQFLSNFDPLTQLPNRDLLRDRTQLILAGAKRRHSPVALMYIGIDRFKIVNESLGPNAGDQLLKEFAERLVGHLRPDDTLCRHSGDEFILVLPNTDAEGAVHTAKKMLDIIAQPFTLYGQRLTVTASIGIAAFPQDGDNFEQLIQSADAALHRAKQGGRNTFQFFTQQMQEQARNTLQIENELRRALEQNEFLLHYQPQVDAKTAQIIGVEALIRWQHPQNGLVSPGIFIPIAEECGLIGEIGTWVLHTAIQQAADWQAAGLPIVPVAVNLSVVQFRQDTLYSTVEQALRTSKLDPAMLELEMTEGIAMENSERTVKMLDQLHALGVALSIDDFGTGYSSLGYLKRFRIDKLKIDQSFVRDLGHDLDDVAIVTAIIGMAKGLGFKTIAEGVETREQLDFLREKRCDEIQGYLFSKPVPAEAFAELLRNSGVFAEQAH
ncbi:MAG TPA: EAL domain-containing protein [Gallionella sp.]|nr:EAL domain-containing protein [Gallionella sp.]